MNLKKIHGAQAYAQRRNVRFPAQILIVVCLALLGISTGTALGDTPSEHLITYPVLGDPLNVAVAAPGDIWYTLPDEDKIGRLQVTPAGLSSTTQYPLPIAGSQPYDIAYGNGAVWFTERGANRIGRIDVETGVLEEYEIPVTDSQPTGIDLDSSGLVWFVTFSSNHLGRFTPATSAFRMFAYQRDGAMFEDVSARRFGALWITAPGVNRAVMFDKIGFRFQEVIQPTKDSLPSAIVVSEVGIPWTTDQGRGEIAFFLPGTGAFWLSISYTKGNGHPVGIDHSTAEDGEHIWFTDDELDVVGQFVIRGNSGFIPPFVSVDDPAGIAVDGEGTAWIAVDGGIAAWRSPYWEKTYLPIVQRQQ